MRRLSQDAADFDRQLHQALQIDESTSKEIEASVDAILAQVREGGDTALRHLVAQYDGIACDTVADLLISKNDMALACERLSPEINEALQHAAARIEAITGASMRSKRPIGALRTSLAMCWGKGLAQCHELESMRQVEKHLIPRRS